MQSLKLKHIESSKAEERERERGVSIKQIKITSEEENPLFSTPNHLNKYCDYVWPIYEGNNP